MSDQVPTQRSPAIVIVDDEPDVTIILHRVLASFVPGLEIVSVHDAASALAQLELRQVPLVITDFNMPGMNGLQLTQRIKEGWPATQVIMVTAYATRKLAQQAHVDYYLAKPFAIERLEHLVRIALVREALPLPSSSY
jgi:two-component system response regulator (stage 0 sporulation protein F)